MILVFGGDGQVGKELRLLSDVIALSKSEADFACGNSCVESIYRNQPKAVINVAAYTAVDRAEEEEKLANLVNGVAPTLIAKACSDLKIPLVHVSTDYVFDGTGSAAWKPDDPVNPQNAYGKSKVMGELGIIESAATYAIIRTSWVFSAHGNNFVKKMVSLSKTQNSVQVVKDQVGGPTPSRAIARACLKIANMLIDDPQKKGVYHFSGAPDISWFGFAGAIFEQLGGGVLIEPAHTSERLTLAKRPLNSRLDCSSIEDVFGIERPYWSDGLHEVLLDLEVAK